jgi:hypothetical protein
MRVSYLLLGLLVLIGNCLAALPQAEKDFHIGPLIPRNSSMEFTAKPLGGKPASITLQNTAWNGNIDLQLRITEIGYARPINYKEVSVSAKTSSGNIVKVVPWIPNQSKPVWQESGNSGQWGEYALMLSPRETLISVTVKWKGDEQTFLISEGKLVGPPPAHHP